MYNTVTFQFLSRVGVFRVCVQITDPRAEALYFPQVGDVQNCGAYLCVVCVLVLVWVFSFLGGG